LEPCHGKEKIKYTLLNQSTLGKLKTARTNKALVAGLPVGMLHFMNYLKTQTYTSKPDYNYIIEIYREMFRESHAPLDVQYDWDCDTLLDHSMDGESKNSIEDLRVPDIHQNLDTVDTNALPAEENSPLISHKPLKLAIKDPDNTLQDDWNTIVPK
jgi:hypothetical protein